MENLVFPISWMACCLILDVSGGDVCGFNGHCGKLTFSGMNFVDDIQPNHIRPPPRDTSFRPIHRLI